MQDWDDVDPREGDDEELFDPDEEVPDSSDEE